MPASQLTEIDESLEEEFRILRVLRERVNGRLEEKRTTKELGKATEAEGILALSHEASAGPEGEVARKYSAQLADLFLCAHVQLETIPEAGREHGVSFDAMVKRSEHPSCARCYRALADVTTQDQIEGAPGLCARCVRAVQG